MANPDTTKTWDEVKGLAKGPKSEAVLKYSFLIRDLVARAKEPGFGPADWAPLAELIDTDNFERVGNFQELVDWQQYVGLLTAWARNTTWDFKAKNVTEGSNYAIQELTEYSGYPDICDTVSIYRFNDRNQIVRLEIYVSKKESLAEARAADWDWQDVEAETVN